MKIRISLMNFATSGSNSEKQFYHEYNSESNEIFMTKKLELYFHSFKIVRP